MLRRYLHNLRKIEAIQPLRLGFIGYNSNLTLYGMREFVENNKENVDYFSGNKRYIRLKDGTCIFALLESNINIRGYDLDQLILFDDDRWEIKKKKCNFICWILENLMYRSCVPEEFQILEYEDVI